MTGASEVASRRARGLPRAAAVAFAAVLVGGLGAAPAAGSAADDVGAPGVGDAYFPRAGNGGYDVDHYDLRLRYDPRTDLLQGTARIDLQATQDLERFNLDLRRPMHVRSVSVDGDRATYDRKGHELRITPEPALGRTDEVTVVVRYRGNPGNPVDITGSPFGWWTTEDGAMVANEADGASTWFPANDHPTDKATFAFDVTLPNGSSAVANGDFRGSEPAGDGWHTWRWRQSEPMATYLATATIGDFEITTSRGPGGLPIIDAIDEDLGEDADDGLVDTSEQLAFYSDTFGPYPFQSYGAIVDDDSVGYALETQNRPIYSGPPSTGLVAHEMAHQWFGDSVTLGRWKDIWLNEGFATYATWLWSEHRGGATPAERFAELYQTPADDPEWTVAPGDPGVQRLFSGAVYWRGAMTLHAVRETVGDRDFFAILRAWVRTHADGHGTTPQLQRLAEDISGEQLDSVFEDWLYLEGKPRGWDRADPGDVVLDDVPHSHQG